MPVPLAGGGLNEVLSVAVSAGDAPMAARCPGQTQAPGRRDVLSQMSTTEVLPCPILSPTPPCSPHPMRPCCSCRPCWPPNGAVAAPAGVGVRWAATGRRCSLLRWFLDGTRLAQLAADNAISTSTAYRYLHEG